MAYPVSVQVSDFKVYARLAMYVRSANTALPLEAEGCHWNAGKDQK
jgi:hypothetical protein